MTIKGILFDKDGTLINIEKLWVNMFDHIVTELFSRLGEPENQDLRKRLLTSIGLNHGTVDGNGYVASGTSTDIANEFQKILPVEVADLHNWIQEKQLDFTLANMEHIEPFGDVARLFSQLKKEGIIIGVVTSDDYQTMSLCLERLGVQDQVQFIAAADLYEPKPSPDAFNVFCAKFGLQQDEVAMVGDTTVDLRFAKNSHARYAIGVLSGASSQEGLSPLADFVIPSIEHLMNKEGRLIWKEN